MASSLKPNGEKSLPDLRSAAGVEGVNFSTVANDPPHFQANDLITRGPDGNVDQTYLDLIKTNQADYTQFEKLRQEDPAEFEKKVTTIDSYTEIKKKEEEAKKR